MELIASVGDDLSYAQDRIAAEATLATATERRSIVRHARLVDYEPSPATSARVTVQVDVGASTRSLPPGVPLIAGTPDQDRIYYEIGDGMLDPTSGELNATLLPVDPRWNRLDSVGNPQLEPYWWDDSKRCLLAGSTSMWLKGHGHALQSGDPQLATVGTALLIDTSAASPIDPPIREVVHLTGRQRSERPAVRDRSHANLLVAGRGVVSDHDLTLTVLAGTCSPATQGRRYTERFEIEPRDGRRHDPDRRGRPGRAAALLRDRPDLPPYARAGRLAWLAPDAGCRRPGDLRRQRRPAAGDSRHQVASEPGDSSSAGAGAGGCSTPRSSRTRSPSTQSRSSTCAAPPAGDRTAIVGIRWRRWRLDPLRRRGVRHPPAEQGQFEVTYRVTRGLAGNVGATRSRSSTPPTSGRAARHQPVPGLGRRRRGDLDAVSRQAPYAFRALKLRAVRREDYDEAAEQLPWVLDAGTAFRWTGSWLTVFTTAQPRGAEVAPVADLVSLLELLNRRRLAGYEVYTPAPRYVSIDLIVTVCALPTALRGEVEAALLTELGTGRRRDGGPAFFAPDQFRSALRWSEATRDRRAAAAGVDGVLAIDYRRRGLVADFEPMPETVTVGEDEILRATTTPASPSAGRCGRRQRGDSGAAAAAQRRYGRLPMRGRPRAWWP